MRDPVRFHLDEHMDPDIAAALRREGIDVTITNETGLRTANDSAQIDFVMRERRVLVTDDHRLIAEMSLDANQPGVVCCHRAKNTIGEIIRFLMLVHEVYDRADMQGRVEYI